MKLTEIEIAFDLLMTIVTLIRNIILIIELSITIVFGNNYYIS